jgi:hypothetical protein
MQKKYTFVPSKRGALFVMLGFLDNLTQIQKQAEIIPNWESRKKKFKSVKAFWIFNFNFWCAPDAGNADVGI